MLRIIKIFVPLSSVKEVTERRMILIGEVQIQTKKIVNLFEKISRSMTFMNLWICETVLQRDISDNKKIFIIHQKQCKEAEIWKSI